MEPGPWLYSLYSTAPCPLIRWIWHFWPPAHSDWIVSRVCLAACSPKVMPFLLPRLPNIAHNCRHLSTGWVIFQCVRFRHLLPLAWGAARVVYILYTYRYNTLTAELLALKHTTPHQPSLSLSLLLLPLSSVSLSLSSLSLSLSLSLLLCLRLSVSVCVCVSLSLLLLLWSLLFRPPSLVHGIDVWGVG